MLEAMQNTLGKVPVLARSLAGAVTVTVLAVGLSGCGSDNDTQPVASTDSFFVEVSKVVASLPDDTEPVAIDAIAETHPDNSDPMPVI